MRSHELAAIVKNARKGGEGWTARCPAHDDQRNSLSFRDADGKILIHCHAGCSTDEILRSLNLTYADLFVPNGTGADLQAPQVKAVYDYADETGNLLFQCVRFEPKNFRQRRPDGRGGWIWDLKGVRRVLYRLREIQGSETVCFAEGEKDADNLAELGLAATTSPMGAGKWRPEYVDQLRAAGAKSVVIFPDNDPQGDRHAVDVAAACFRAGLLTKIVNIPDIEEHGDISDWLAVGRTARDVNDLVSGTPILLTVPAPKADPASRRHEKVQPDGRPEIVVEGGGLPSQIDQAEAALLKHPAGESLFQRGGMLVERTRLPRASVEHGVERSAGSLVLRAVSPSRLVEIFTQAAIFKKWDGRMKDHRPIDCPKDLAISYLARPSWGVRPLSGISEGPTLRPDGSILEAEGYDDQTGLLLDFGGVEFPPVPENPGRGEALAALGALKELFAGFPFVSPAHRSAAIAAPLTGSIRRSLHAAPMIPLSATAPGTGKSLFTDVVSIILTGREASAMSQGSDEAEDEKRLMASLMGGDLVLNIDNVEKTLKGGTICSILTQSAFKGRILGESRMLTLPTDILVMANGNNLELAGDITSRAILVQMDAGIERPEQRHFDINLRKEAALRRPELLVACLTILRAHHVAGRPSMGLAQWGRFEDWSGSVRAALVWLGEPDPLETTEELRKTDPARTNLLNLLSSWHSRFGDMPMLLHSVIGKASEEEHEPLHEAVLAIAGDGRNKINTRILSWTMRRHLGQIAGGFRILRDDTFDSSAARWRVEKLPVANPPIQPKPEPTETENSTNNDEELF